MKHQSIEVTICCDFLKKFSPTKATSRYSPTTTKLVKECILAYPTQDGVYPIRASHMIAAARMLNLEVKLRGGGEAMIGISAGEFNSRKVRAVFDDDILCVDGFAPYTFILSDGPNEPKKKACCKTCNNGQELPTELEIERAKKCLRESTNSTGHNAGALILAARALGYAVIRTLDGKFKISRVKNGEPLLSLKEAASE